MSLADTTALLERTPLVVRYDEAVGPWKAYLGILLRRDHNQ